MEKYISQPDDIVEEAIKIQGFCDTINSEGNSDNASYLMEKGNQLEVFISRTGKMLADAKYWYNAETAKLLPGVIHTLKDVKYSSKVQNALIESMAKNERLLVDMLERLNRTCTHQADFIRSTLSYIKEEMKIQGYNNRRS